MSYPPLSLLPACEKTTPRRARNTKNLSLNAQSLHASILSEEGSLPGANQFFNSTGHPKGSSSFSRPSVTIPHTPLLAHDRGRSLDNGLNLSRNTSELLYNTPLSSSNLATPTATSFQSSIPSGSKVLDNNNPQSVDSVYHPVSTSRSTILDPPTKAKASTFDCLRSLSSSPFFMPQVKRKTSALSISIPVSASGSSTPTTSSTLAGVALPPLASPSDSPSSSTSSMSSLVDSASPSHSTYNTSPSLNSASPNGSSDEGNSYTNDINGNILPYSKLNGGNNSTNYYYSNNENNNGENGNENGNENENDNNYNYNYNGDSLSDGSLKSIPVSSNTFMNNSNVYHSTNSNLTQDVNSTATNTRLDPITNTNQLKINGRITNQPQSYKNKSNNMLLGSLDPYPNGPVLVIGPNIYLYSEPTIELASQFDVVVNVAFEVNPLFESRHIDDISPTMPVTMATTTATTATTKIPEYYHIRWTHTSTLLEDLPKLCDLLLWRTQANKRILVHCQCGVSRSASLLVAFIMREKSLGLNEAYKVIKTSSPVIGPNMRLIFQLVDWGKWLKGELASSDDEEYDNGNGNGKNNNNNNNKDTIKDDLSSNKELDSDESGRINVVINSNEIDEEIVRNAEVIDGDNVNYLY